METGVPFVAARSSCEADEQCGAFRSGVGGAKDRDQGNANQQSTRRAQDRESVSQALERVRLAARRGKKEKFTSLLHHVDPEPIAVEHDFEQFIAGRQTLLDERLKVVDAQATAGRLPDVTVTNGVLKIAPIEQATWHTNCVTANTPSRRVIRFSPHA
jgi:hypothetical protein